MFHLIQTTFSLKDEPRYFILGATTRLQLQLPFHPGQLFSCSRLLHQPQYTPRYTHLHICSYNISYTSFPAEQNKGTDLCMDSVDDKSEAPCWNCPTSAQNSFESIHRQTRICALKKYKWSMHRADQWVTGFQRHQYGHTL